MFGRLAPLIPVLAQPAMAAIATAQVAPSATAPVTSTAAATTIVADRAFTARAGQLPGVIAGAVGYDTFFAPAMRAALPRERWAAVVAQVSAQMGRPLAVAAVVATGRWTGTVRVRFERGIVNVQLAVDPAAPHAVIGLYFTGSEVAGDNFARLAADFRALPGTAAFVVRTLDGAPNTLAGLHGEDPAPLGSAFKLWVLGDLARAVAAGERRWSDVVPLGPPSLPSGITQGWPAGSPVTLHTLATLMISISDNSATDTLVTLAGNRLDRYVADAGAPGLAPVLTTRQMFAIKSTANADLAARWAAIAPAGRRALLDANAARLAATPIEAGMFAGRPIAIDTLEWFASPLQTAAMLDRLRRDGGAAALAILAVNPGTDAATRARFAYIGFKGGSEPGVLTLAYLERRRDGHWLALAGSWHRADEGVDEARFAALMSRALVLAADAALP